MTLSVCYTVCRHYVCDTVCMCPTSSSMFEAPSARRSLLCSRTTLLRSVALSLKVVPGQVDLRMRPGNNNTGVSCHYILQQQHSGQVVIKYCNTNTGVSCHYIGQQQHSDHVVIKYCKIGEVKLICVICVFEILI